MQFNTVFQDWLSVNKISKSVQDMFGISFTDKIVFPVHDNEGNFLFNKYRRNPMTEEGSKYTYDVGGKVTLYGYHLAKVENKIIILEGEKDTLVAWSNNIPAVTSTGGAMSFQSDWSELLKDKEVIICLDNDKAGGEGMVKVLDIVRHAKVVFIPDMANVKDISDYVNAGGDLHELLRTAVSLNTIEDVKQDRCKRIALFQSVFFHDAYIKKHTKVNPYKGERKTFSDDNVTNAKEFLITELLDFDWQGNTRCIFHNEKSASLHYYEKTNTCYCFGGCGKSYDAISIYKQLHNCSFKEAVTALKK